MYLLFIYIGMHLNCSLLGGLITCQPFQASMFLHE